MDWNKWKWMNRNWKTFKGKFFNDIPSFKWKDGISGANELWYHMQWSMRNTLQKDWKTYASENYNGTEIKHKLKIKEEEEEEEDENLMEIKCRKFMHSNKKRAKKWEKMTQK